MSMIFAQEEIAISVMTLLSGDGTLTALLATNERDGATGIVDFVPENQTFPYVEIGDMQSKAFRTLSRSGEEVLVTIKVHTATLGGAEARAIQKEINRLLGDVTSIGTVAGYTFIASYFMFAEMLKEVDSAKKIKRVIVSRFRMQVQQVAGF